MNLPVTEIRDALRVLNTNFDVSKYPEAYVNFQEVRPEGYSEQLLIKLNIFNDKLDPDTNYSKILFTGHTGSGKTTELHKLDSYLNHQDRYFVVFADIQENFQITTFEQEDLYVLLIIKLIEKLNERNINFEQDSLNALAAEWIQDDEEIEKEINKGIKLNAEVEASAQGSLGALFWKWLSLKGSLKTVFSYESGVSSKVRSTIKANKGTYIQRFNEILIEIKKAIQEENQGLDILFIIDGVERLRYEKYNVYVNSFFRDARLLMELNTNFICCVPIDTRYDITVHPLIAGLYSTYELPLISLNDHSMPYFREIITKRIQKDVFIADSELDYLIQKSGGHPRKLLVLVEKALTYSISNNGKITREAAEKACAEEGRLMRRLLTSKHVEILKSGEYMNADSETLELLFSLALLEYNGTANTRKLNPLLEGLI